MATTCKHCERPIVNEGGRWVDPEATGDDSVWRETCDGHDTFVAEHEPRPTIGVCWCGRPATALVVADAASVCDEHKPADGRASFPLVACDACGADVGEPCGPMCLGLAAAQDSEAEHAGWPT